MSFENVIVAVMTEIKQKLTDFCKSLNNRAPLSPELSVSFSSGLKDSLAAGGVAGLRTFLESFDINCDKLEIGGDPFYRKRQAPKVFLLLLALWS